jgi:hypothetical protein
MSKASSSSFSPAYVRNRERAYVLCIRVHCTSSGARTSAHTDSAQLHETNVHTYRPCSQMTRPRHPHPTCRRNHQRCPGNCHRPRPPQCTLFCDIHGWTVPDGHVNQLFEARSKTQMQMQTGQRDAPCNQCTRASKQSRHDKEHTPSTASASPSSCMLLYLSAMADKLRGTVHTHGRSTESARAQAAHSCPFYLRTTTMKSGRRFQK